MPYFNAASHGLPDPCVYTAMADFLEMQLQPQSERTACEEAGKLLAAKSSVASVLSANVEQLGFTSTTTAAWHAIVGALDLSGKRVLVTEHEWGDFYRLLKKRTDVEIQVLPPLDFDNPDLSTWEQMFDDDVAAIFVPFITSIAGHRYPVEDIAALPRPQGTKLIVDAAQALGQTEIDVTRLKCDAIISTCRKWMRGPRQTALFWINDKWVTDQGPISAQMLAPADQNSALIAGLGAAAQSYLKYPKQQLEHQLLSKADSLRTWASANGIAVCGGPSAKSAIVSLRFDKSELMAVSRALDAEGIVAKVVDPRVAEPLLTGLTHPQPMLRLTAHFYNSDGQIQRLKEVISGAL